MSGKGRVYKAEHPPIVDEETFAAVQTLLAESATERRGRARNGAFILVGLLHDDAGHRMSHSHANEVGVRYRYYVSQALLKHRKAEAGSIARVSVPDIEAAITAALPLDRMKLRERCKPVSHRDMAMHPKSGNAPPQTGGGKLALAPRHEQFTRLSLDDVRANSRHGRKNCRDGQTLSE